MTREEAIKLLANATYSDEWQGNEDLTTAYNMAIKALEQQPCEDTISRQAAIDAVKKNTFRLTFAEEQNCEGHVEWSANAVYSDVMEGALLELPSAQPATSCSEIPNNSGTISRQDAIDALTALEESAPTALHLSAIFDCEDAIKALPSA